MAATSSAVAAFDDAVLSRRAVASFDVGVRNLSLCITRFDGTSDRIEHWEVADILLERGFRKKTCTIAEATECLVAFLESRVPLFEDVGTVVIESQPAGFRVPNAKMKTLSHVAQGWCCARGLRVLFCNPKKKLAGLPGAADASAEKNAKKRYRMHKKMCEEETARRLRANGEPAERVAYFEQLPKKDDASDAYLQALLTAREERERPAAKKRKRRKPTSP